MSCCVVVMQVVVQLLCSCYVVVLQLLAKGMISNWTLQQPRHSKLHCGQCSACNLGGCQSPHVDVAVILLGATPARHPCRAWAEHCMRQSFQKLRRVLLLFPLFLDAGRVGAKIFQRTWLLGLPLQLAAQNGMLLDAGSKYTGRLTQQLHNKYITST